MFALATTMSFLLLLGGGVTMPYDTNIAIGLYLSTPIPLIVRKVVQHYTYRPREESKHPQIVVEDPVAPSADEPSAV